MPRGHDCALSLIVGRGCQINAARVKATNADDFAFVALVHRLVLGAALDARAKIERRRPALMIMAREPAEIGADDGASAPETRASNVAP